MTSVTNEDVSDSPGGKTHAQLHPVPSVADYLGQPNHGTPPDYSYNSVLVTMDRLSKWAHFIATTSDITSLGVAQDGVWKLHGLPKEVISDRGP